MANVYQNYKLPSPLLRMIPTVIFAFMRNTVYIRLFTAALFVIAKDEK